MAKIRTPNTAPLGLHPLKDLPRGEYVKRVDVCQHCQSKGWINKQGAYVHGGYTVLAQTESCRECDGKGYTKEYNTVWIKGDYNRSFPNAGKFELTRFDDVNTTCYRSGSVLVLAGFTF